MQATQRSIVYLLAIVCLFCLFYAPDAFAQQGQEPPLVRVFGLIKPTMIAGNGVESYGFANYSATTAAANPLFFQNPDDLSLSFQVAQSRLGVVVGEALPVRGTLELDFIHFDQASPVQAAFPRVRLAFVDWHMNDQHRLILGQNWDLFSPLGVHGFDLVGGSFQAGNSGFLRQQFQWLGMFGAVEAGLAVGLQAPNNTAAVNNVELGHFPSLALRVAYKPSKGNQAGVSAIATRLRFTDDKFSYAYGATLYGEVTAFNNALNARLEAYYGTNLNNMGALTLGQGYADKDVSEVGGFLSVKHSFTTAHALHLVAGFAMILNPDDMKLGYTPAVAAVAADPTATPPVAAVAAVAAARAPGNGPGIEQNLNLRLGYSYSPLERFSLVLEPFLLLTRHKLDDVALSKFDADRKGYGAQVGALYQF